MRFVPFFTLLVLSFLLLSCEQKITPADAYGNFEAVETIVSAEANGRLLFLNVEEGQTIPAGQLVALVDTTQLHLQKLQLQSSLGAIAAKTKSAQPQIAVYEEQIRNLQREQKRIQALLADKAATPKQLDDINGQIDVVQKQIASAGVEVGNANRGILSERQPVLAQIKVIEEQIRKCYIYNARAGTVLLKLAEPSEVVGFGSPLYKVADLSALNLRAYLSAQQLEQVAIGQQFTVRIDNGPEQYFDYPGEVVWIASEAEFTPKTIQTKQERVNLVYAVKVKVKNDGRLKIGMPGELILPPAQTAENAPKN